ncbi:MAG: hypothetical protein NVSMB19_26020 [Vulcanimicrobiaceae bacterium]
MGTRTCEPFAVSLFGMPKFRSGDAPLRLALARTTLTFLAYLLLHRATPLRRDDVAFAIWPDDAEAEARANLRRHVYLLSRALPPGDVPWIVSDHRVVAWNPDAPLELDVEQFERLAGDPATRLQAIELYGGDLLADVEAEWLDERRRYYRSLFCNVALGAARDEMNAGAHARGASLAQSVVAVDPWQEDAIRIVVACRLQGGDRAGALATYLDFERRLRDELDTEPMPETRQLFETIAAGAHVGIPDATFASRAPLPQNLSRFIGREREIAAVASALETCRLVTLIGAGGVGKSRLAIRVAESIRARFAQEPLFVEFGSVPNDGALFEARVRDAFGLAAGHDDIVDALARVLGSRACLLLLDNVEHLSDIAARFLAGLLARARGVTVLVTSRQPLHLPGEQIVGLRPLELPGPDPFAADLLTSESVRLFIDRAGSLNADMHVSPADARYISAICRRLDGIPLAIELAAARSNVLTPKEIDARLADRFTLLKTRNVSALRHHQTLRATLDWSFDQLDASERQAFCRLGVFKNGWTLDAAKAVISPGAAEDVDALESLAALIDKSLVIVCEAAGSRRYDFLETIRAYALLRLAESGDLPDCRRAVAAYFAGYVDRQCKLLGSLHEKSAFDCFASEHDNVLAVIDDTIATHDGDTDMVARLACGLSSFWVVRGHAAEAQPRVEALLSVESRVAPGLRRRLCNVSSELHYRRGDIAGAMLRADEALAHAGEEPGDAETAEALFARARCWYASNEIGAAASDIERALTIFRHVDDRRGVARSLDFLGQVAEREMRGADATALYRQSLSMYEEAGDLLGVATVNYHLGFQAYKHGKHETSIVFSTKAIDVWGAYGNLQGKNWAQYNVACAEAALGRSESATYRHLTCIGIAHRYGFVRDVSDGLERIATLTIDYAPDVSATCMGYAAQLRKKYGHATLPNERNAYEADVLRVERLLGETAFRSAWHAGETAEQEALIELVSSAIRRHFRM